MNKVMVFILIAALLTGCSVARPPAPTSHTRTTPNLFTSFSLYAHLCLRRRLYGYGNCYKDHKEAVAKGEMSADVLKFFDENWQKQGDERPGCCGNPG